jgi:hypothetical protein
VKPAFVIEQVASCVGSTAAQPLFKDAHRSIVLATCFSCAAMPSVRSSCVVAVRLLLRLPLASHFAPQRPCALADNAGRSFRLMTSEWRCHRLSLAFVPDSGLALRCILALGFAMPLPTVASIAVAVTADASTATREWECLASVLDKLLLRRTVSGECCARCNGADVERDLLAPHNASDVGASRVESRLNRRRLACTARRVSCVVRRSRTVRWLAHESTATPAAAQATGRWIRRYVHAFFRRFTSSTKTAS